MKTNKLFVYMVCASMLAFGSACNDGGNDGQDGTDPGIGDYTNSPLTPEEHKVKIENIGKNFVAKFNAAENEKIAKAIYDLQEMIDNSNFNDIFGDEDEAVAPVSPYEYLTLLTKAITKNDISAMTKASANPEIYDWVEYTGIYTAEPDKYSDGWVWTKQPANKQLIIKFNSETLENKACELNVSYTGDKEYTKYDGYVITVPETITITLTADGAEVLKSHTQINLKDNDTAVDATFEVSINGNYIWKATMTATDSKATVDYHMTVHGEELMSANATLEGKGMSNPNSYEDNEDNLDQMLKKANMTFKVMTLTMTGESDLAGMIKGYNNLGDYAENWHDEDGLKKEAEEEVAVFNQYGKIAMYYTDNKSEKIADVKLKATFETENYWDWDPIKGTEISGQYKDWYTTPALVFVSDGSSIELENYFDETGFSSLISATEALINDFCKMLSLDPVEL